MSDAELSRIVKDLTALIGWPPFAPPSPGAEINLGNPLIVQGLRKWVEIMGVPHSRAQSDPAYKLTNSWNSQSYLSAWAKGASKDGARTRGRTLNWDDDTASAPSTSPAPSASPEPSRPFIDPVTATPAPARLDEQSITRVVEVVITPRLTAIREDLARTTATNIRTTIHAEISNLDLTSSVTSALDNLFPAVEKKILTSVEKLADQIVFDAIIKSRTPAPVPASSVEPDAELPAPDPNSIAAYIPPLDPNYHFDPYASKVIRAALAMNENLYAYGDTGCGKTTHLEQVCAVMNRGISRINPHDGATREMFLGGMKLIAGETKFVEGALPRAMRLGLVFLVDEISFLPPNLTAILNPVGEPGGKLYIPETGDWIAPAPGFCIFATDNTGGKGDRTGQYTGTEVQNTATLDRFAFCLKMDYLPIDKEREMLRGRFPSVPTSELEAILNLATDIRTAFSIGQLAITFSTRKLIKFFEQRARGFTTSEALSNTLLSWLDEDDMQLIKTMLDRLGWSVETDANTGAAK